jgi:UDP:flavonoid glycosyltransferase YjiC (YdhE family)
MAAGMGGGADVRVLFMTWAWPTHFYPMVPLAWAFRNAGHDVRVASQPALVDTIRRCGLNAIPLGSDSDIADALGRLKSQDMSDRRRRSESRTVARYAEMAGAMAAPAARLLGSYAPHLVVYEETTFIAPLAAEVAGIPSVRHLWGVDVMSYVRWSEPISLAPLVRRLGATSHDGSRVATVDPCPPSLQVPADYERMGMRYVPYNGNGSIPVWLHEAPTRPRVCVTYGQTLSQVSRARYVIDLIVEAVGALDVDVIAAITAGDRQRLGTLPANVRVVENLPLSSFLGSCSLVISHGGPGTALTAAACGVPQLSIPQVGDQILLGELTTRQGCGVTIPVDEAEVDRIREQAARLLTDADVRRAAAVLAEENAARPSPASIVNALVERAVRYPTEPTRPPTGHHPIKPARHGDSSPS